MMNPPKQGQAGSRFRGLVFLWVVQVLSLAVLLTIMQFIKLSTQGGPNQSLLVVFVALALTVFSLSFVLKAQFISRAMTQHRPDLVTTGYVLAFALCEACAILGIVARITSGAHESIYFVAAALVGFLLHFPRRQHVDDASSDQGQSFPTTL
ncbi:MAG: hypothetical protein QOE33_2044 [Acidobacteriota bacterium]|nr:hypothetical protein [Acidobacteriota bacterium]